MIKKQPTVSIIIPVYNVGEYLQHCLDSVVSQTFQHLEVVLVDDGSTDGSENVCDLYADRYSFVKVIHKENSGSSDSRNMGIEASTGQYLMFVDSDDYVHVGIVDYLVRLLEENSADISVCGFGVVAQYSVDSEQIKVSEKISRYDPQEALSNLMYTKGLTNSPWAKLYKKSTFAGIRYQSGKINQDLGTTYKVFSQARSIVLSSRVMYYYVQREGSVINSAFSARRMAGLEFAYEELEFIKQRFPRIVPAARNRLFMEAVSIALKIGKERKDLGRRYWMACRVAMMNNRYVVLFDRKSSLQSRVYAATSIISPSLIFTVYSLQTFLQNKKAGVARIIRAK